MTEDQVPYIVTGKSKSPRGPTLARAKRAVNEIDARDFIEGCSAGKKARKPRAPEQLESEITKAIRAILNTVGIRHWKQLGTLGSESGLPDIIGLKKVKVADLVAQGALDVGVFVGIEVKRPKGKLSEKQEKWKRRILESGGIFIEARSIDDAIDGLNLRKHFLF